MAEKPMIALCLEYPLGLRGGVSVLVEALLEGLADHYRLLLVSADTPESLFGTPAARLAAEHFQWDPAKPTPQSAAELAAKIAKQGVVLAHFHFGGNYGWSNRRPSRCPIPHLARLRVPVCTTIHLVVSPMDGYCGPKKPWLFKLALLPFAWWAKVRVLGHIRKEIAVSQHDAKKLRRWYWPRRKRIEQLYHSRLIRARHTATVRPREPMILNVGHIAWRKGQLVLCQAFAEIADKFPEWKLVLAGDLMEEDIVAKIRDVARTAKIENRIELLGPRKDAIEWMKRAAIYVQPSIYEALGLALQEAMYLGCPAIGSRTGGIPELIDHERNGLLVRRDHVRELAGALERLMSQPELRERFGREAAASIEQKGMTVEQMTANHLHLYESILHVA